MADYKDDGDIYGAGGAEAGAAKSYDGYVGYSEGAANPYGSVGAIDPSMFNPMLGGGMGMGGGMGGGRSFEPEYLHYEPKSWAERMFYNTGSAYLAGIGLGGGYGVINGLRTSPSPKMKIRLNSVLNKSGRFGSRFGNALGAIAMMYSCFEAGADKLHIEDYLGGDEFVNPVLAATLTGLLYKSTQGPKTMALAGVIGGVTVAGLAGLRRVMGTRRISLLG